MGGKLGNALCAFVAILVVIPAVPFLLARWSMLKRRTPNQIFSDGCNELLRAWAAEPAAEHYYSASNPEFVFAIVRRQPDGTTKEWALRAIDAACRDERGSNHDS